MESQTEKDLTCPVCHDIFNNPVILTCSHSFCKDCVKSWWRERLIQQCPVCKVISATSDPPRNLALKNLCEAFVVERDQRPAAESDARCGLHDEKLKLYCLNHQEPVCVVCRDSDTHAGHKFRTIREVARDHKVKMRRILKPVREKLKTFERVRGNCDQTAEYIKVQVRNTERQIKKQFKKLHRFLDEEEEARICALRDEEERKRGVMAEKMEGLNREIAALSGTIRATEEEMKADDVSFMQNYTTAVRRVQQRPLQADPELVPRALIDEAKHLGNLLFQVHSKMRKMVSFSPVILDPNSAHPELVLSADLTGAGCGERRPFPNNPERFDSCISVLGSEGFDSGTHSWRVMVGDSPAWILGVAAESVQRKGGVASKSGLWRILFHRNEYSAWSPAGPEAETETLLSVKKLRYIRIDLDCDRGRYFEGHSRTQGVLLACSQNQEPNPSWHRILIRTEPVFQSSQPFFPLLLATENSCIMGSVSPVGGDDGPQRASGLVCRPAAVIAIDVDGSSLSPAERLSV
ncbi:E3 ubiquitin-protein ligase TRIM35-like [Halichoeres trimaculatus]|uniref:E3 ubiquitin-protein ligase TRIM35-like n=1 Tax=Halichoeres trimaculatus TaxID=147232 RepID=UPI003D9F2B2D